ncbi:MAG: hypothetical protein ABFD18_07525 [Syntrophomonas sp.]
MTKCKSVMTDTEFNCLLAISSDAFDIHNFLTDFIKGEKMNHEQYLYLLDTASDLLDHVKTFREIVTNIHSVPPKAESINPCCLEQN